MQTPWEKEVPVVDVKVMIKAGLITISWVQRHRLHRRRLSGIDNETRNKTVESGANGSGLIRPRDVVLRLHIPRYPSLISDVPQTKSNGRSSSTSGAEADKRIKSWPASSTTECSSTTCSSSTASMRARWCRSRLRPKWCAVRASTRNGFVRTGESRAAVCAGQQMRRLARAVQRPVHFA